MVVLPCSGEKRCSVEGDASPKGFLEAAVPPLITIVALLAIGSLVSGGLFYHFKILNVTITGSMMGGSGLVLSVCVIGWIVRSVKNTRSHPTAPPVTHPAESSVIVSVKLNEMAGVSAPSMPPPSCPDGARRIDRSEQMAEPQPSCSPVTTSQGQDHMQVARSTSPTPSVVNLGHLHADVQKRWIAFLPLRDALVMSRVNKVFQTIFAEENGDIWENLCPPQCRWKNASATWKAHCLSFLPMPIGVGLWNKPRSLTVQRPTWSSQFIDSMKTQVKNYKFLTPQEIKPLIEQSDTICLFNNLHVEKNANNLCEDQQYGQTEKWNLRYVARQQVDSTAFEIFSYINVVVFLDDNRQLMYCNDPDNFNPREARYVHNDRVIWFTEDDCQIVVYRDDSVHPIICATNRDIGERTKISYPTFEIKG
jgi:hypothetical protein